MSFLRLTGFALFLTAIAPHLAAAQYQGAQNPIGAIIGGLLRNTLVSQAQSAWESYDQNIVACINSSGSVNVPTLVNQGIFPTDPRLSSLIQQCQSQIAAQQAQAAQQREQDAEQQQQAQAAAQQAAQQQAQEQAAQQQAAALAAQQQAQQDAQAIADAKLAAEEQATATKVTTSFIAFQNKTVDPNDHTASLLNYTSFGSDSGSENDFWERKDKTGSIYVEYQKGVTIQEPVEILQELDVSTIDPSKLYIKEQSGSAIVKFGSTTFSSCESCSQQILQSRWIAFFQSQSK